MSDRNAGELNVKNTSEHDAKNFQKNIKETENIGIKLSETNKDSSLLTQINSYDKKKTESFIDCITDELVQQKLLNGILRNTEIENISDENLTKITEFVSDNNIDDQINKIENIYTELQDILIENDELKNKSEKIIKLEEDNIDLANKMKDLKSLKFKIADFLDKRGIVSIYS